MVAIPDPPVALAILLMDAKIADGDLCVPELISHEIGQTQSNITVVVARNDWRVGIMQQGPPIENRQANLALCFTRKRLRPYAFINDGADVWMACHECFGGLHHLALRGLKVSERSVWTFFWIPEFVELGHFQLVLGSADGRVEFGSIPTASRWRSVRKRR